MLLAQQRKQYHSAINTERFFHVLMSEKLQITIQRNKSMLHVKK